MGHNNNNNNTSERQKMKTNKSIDSIKTLFSEYGTSDAYGETCWLHSSEVIPYARRNRAAAEFPTNSEAEEAFQPLAEDCDSLYDFRAKFRYVQKNRDMGVLGAVGTESKKAAWVLRAILAILDAADEA